MLFSLPFEPRQLEALALATAIGLLMGLERERRPNALAGVRTFGLTGLLGAIAALLTEQLATPALLIAGFALVALMIIAANFRQPEPNDPGTTSVIALLVCYTLGAMVWLGNGGGPGTVSLHNSRYDFNDMAIPFGVSFFVRTVERFLDPKAA